MQAPAGAPDTDDNLALAFAGVVGAEHVVSEVDALRPYAHDRLPYANFRARTGALAGVLPSLALRPANAEELAEIVRIAGERKTRLIPFGNGSGVLGGAIPLAGEVTVDLRRLDQLVSIDAENGMATVEAGMNGAAFEAALNAKGYTCGHYPQSIEISTVGGWAACRGGGQASSRYGKIEDMVLGLKAVLPDGSSLEIRPVPRRSAGPSVRDLLVGSEGTLGIITELTLRIWKKPEIEHDVALAFPSLKAAWGAAREIMQAELRPAVVRIYDEAESKERTAGLDVFGDLPVLAILVFSGLKRLADTERDLALEIVARHGGAIAPDRPAEEWRKNRYAVLSTKWQDAGYYNDTIEVTGNWSAIPAMYEMMREAVRAIDERAHFGAHWSHVYAEGACQYMTVRLPPMEQDEALPKHRAIWDALQRLAVQHDGAIAHHHGIGVFRNPWLARELGGAMPVLQKIKDALDPDNLMNPGKLGLRPPPGAAVVGKF